MVGRAVRDVVECSCGCLPEALVPPLSSSQPVKKRGSPERENKYEKRREEKRDKRVVCLLGFHGNNESTRMYVGEFLKGSVMNGRTF